MPQIVVENLVKTFRVAERKPGLLGALAGVVHRRYRTVRALDGIGFAIEPGELVGYIGPNGAGKSTTVKSLAGILVPDSGRCEVMGRVPWKQRVDNVREMGVVFGQRTQLWWDLPVIESFELLRDIYRVDGKAYRANLDQLVALLDLPPLLDVPVRQLSLGQRMRCDLTAALLHSPKILYLDEPTIGLDAVSKLAVGTGGTHYPFRADGAWHIRHAVRRDLEFAANGRVGFGVGRPLCVRREWDLPTIRGPLNRVAHREPLGLDAESVCFFGGQS